MDTSLAFQCDFGTCCCIRHASWSMDAFRTIRSMQRVARPDLLVLQLIAQLIFLNVASSLPPEYCSNPVYAGVPIVSLTSSSIVTAPLPATHYWWVCYPSFSYAGSSISSSRFVINKASLSLPRDRCLPDYAIVASAVLHIVSKQLFCVLLDDYIFICLALSLGRPYLPMIEVMC